jgi:hypothetical protein
MLSVVSAKFTDHSATYMMYARYTKKSGSSKFFRFETRTATRVRTNRDVRTIMATFVCRSSFLVMGVFGKGLCEDMVTLLMSDI